MNTHTFINTTVHAVLAGVLSVVVVTASFFVLEPRVGQAVDGTPFTVKTTITDEISFLVQAANVTATGSINGITGGTANGSTTAVVRTNSFTGYEMFIAFTNNGTPNAMLGDDSDSQSIRDYPAVGGEPTFLFSTASTSAVFGYTVGATEESDLDPSFLDDGADCNVTIGLGGAYTADRCWMEPQVTSFQIIDRTSSAPSGATTTLAFRIHVPNNPTPSLVADVYTATATLTALNQ
jgi:hypothetical protein